MFQPVILQEKKMAFSWKKKKNQSWFESLYQEI